MKGSIMKKKTAVRNPIFTGGGFAIIGQTENLSGNKITIIMPLGEHLCANDWGGV
jgi:hypothetical protein